MNNLVFHVISLNLESKLLAAYEDLGMAKLHAGHVAGSHATIDLPEPSGASYLFGPGNGTFTVVVRKLPRQWAEDAGVKVVERGEITAEINAAQREARPS